MPTQVGIHDLLAATKKVVDADLRQHDDVANSRASVVSSVGIMADGAEDSQKNTEQQQVI